MESKRLRLRGKQTVEPWTSTLEEAHPTKPIRAKKTHLKESNCIPKARKPFALFMLEKANLPKGMTRAECRSEFKLIGEAWKALPEKEKAHYQNLSAQEFHKQREKKKELGLRVRGQSSPLPPERPIESTEEKPLRIGNFQILQEKPGIPDSECVKIGEGAYGCVLAGLCPLGRLCAVKVFKHNQERRDFDHESEILRKLQDIPKHELRGLFPQLLASDSSQRPWPHIATEYYGRTMRSWLEQNGHFQIENLTFFGWQLQKGLQTLHSLQILHLDVKTSNILWCGHQRQMKLIDFGMAEYFDSRSEQPSHRFGAYCTASSRPPELFGSLSDSEIPKLLAPAVDIWSYVCVMYEVSTADVLMKPFDSKATHHYSVKQWCQHWQEMMQLHCRKGSITAQRSVKSCFMNMIDFYLLKGQSEFLHVKQKQLPCFKVSVAILAQAGQVTQQYK